MDADVDVDVTIHLGSFKNVGLFSRGLYFVRVSLCHAGMDEKLSPMGFFSAPRKYMSSVDGQEVAQPQVLEWMHVCQISESQDAFETRVVTIRFKDERVELNSGVHYRVGVQDVRNVVAGVEAPFEITFELIHSAFADLKPGHSPDDVGGLMPERPTYTVVGKQTLRIVRVMDAFHEYFPVTFDRLHFCQLDTMVHVAVSAIRYHWISFAALPTRVASGRRTPTLQQKDQTATVDLKDDVADGETAGHISPALIDDLPFGVNDRKLSADLVDDPVALQVSELRTDNDDHHTEDEKIVPAEELDAEIAACGVPVKQLLELACVYLSPLEALTKSVVTALSSIQDNQSQGFGRFAVSRGRRVIAPDITRDHVEEVLASVAQWLPGEDVREQLRKCRSKGAVKTCIRDLTAQLSAHCALLWNRFVTTLPLEAYNTEFEMRARWLQDTKVFWRQRCIVDAENVANILQPQQHCTAQHQPAAAFIRQHIKRMGLGGMVLVDSTMFPDEAGMPIAYLQQYATAEALQQLPREPVLGAPLLYAPSSTAGNAHSAGGLLFWKKPKQVFVLVHGFMGNAYDMYLIRNYILLVIPDAIVCCSEVNENSTTGKLAAMSKRLADEVASFLMSKCPSVMHPESKDSLTFIGHSIGGLIIRAALQEPALEPCRGQLHTFVSLSTPHLGTLLAQSQLVATGMWALFKLRKSPILGELRLEDANKFESCYLYQLNQSPTLQWFKHVVFVSSHNDGYVSYQSARAQVMPETTLDSAASAVDTKFRVLATMLLDSMGSLEKLVRVDIESRMQQVSVDSIIGRAAHIQYLEDPAVACQLVFTLLPYLEL